MSRGGRALRPLPWSHHYLQTEILDSQVMELNICWSLLFPLWPVNLTNPTFALFVGLWLLRKEMMQHFLIISYFHLDVCVIW